MVLLAYEWPKKKESVEQTSVLINFMMNGDLSTVVTCKKESEIQKQKEENLL